jgi:surfactin synthase thioesterase subunit
MVGTAEYQKFLHHADAVPKKMQLLAVAVPKRMQHHADAVLKRMHHLAVAVQSNKK